MRGRGRKLVAIQTKTQCLKSNTWSTPPTQDVWSLPSRNASTQRDGSLQRQDGGRHFLLSCSCPAASWHKLGLLQSDPLSSMQTARLCCWHQCVSVWIATSFRPRPRMIIDQCLHAQPPVPAAPAHIAASLRASACLQGFLKSSVL
jgi:hypothetical protein